MQDPLVVTFDSPHSGSLCAHLVTGTVTATIGASYIPNDFLEDLVRALLNVTLRTGTFNAVANDEPNIQCIQFESTGLRVDLRVRHGAHQEYLALEYSAETAAVVLPFWRALRRLQHDPALPEWRRSFPDREMTMLMAQVERLKHVG